MEYKKLGKIPGMSGEAAYQLLIQFNNTHEDYPTEVCLHQIFESQVEQTPNSVALEFDGTQLTYSELNSKTNQLAHHLQHLGVGPEVAVGV
jgi:non-ribosomal peptide synthetase component F